MRPQKQLPITRQLPVSQLVIHLGEVSAGPRRYKFVSNFSMQEDLCIFWRRGRSIAVELERGSVAAGKLYRYTVAKGHGFLQRQDRKHSPSLRFVSTSLDVKMVRPRSLFVGATALALLFLINPVLSNKATDGKKQAPLTRTDSIKVQATQTCTVNGVKVHDYGIYPNLDREPAAEGFVYKGVKYDTFFVLCDGEPKCVGIPVDGCKAKPVVCATDKSLKVSMTKAKDLTKLPPAGTPPDPGAPPM